MLRYDKNLNFTRCSAGLNESQILTQLSCPRIIVLREIDSTNQYIIDNIPYIRSGDACVTEYQTQGRGRRDKIWVTPFGEGIGLSIYWQLNQPPPTIIAFSLMVSVVVARILKNFGVSQIKVKWPNDLYIHGRKLAGILIEIITRTNSITHIIIGIGINLSIRTHTTLNAKIGRKWIDLKDIGVMLDRNILVATLVNVLRKELKDFMIFGFAPFIYYWKVFDCLYHKRVTLLIDDHEIYDGTVIGINMHGALIVEQAAGSVCYYLGDNISVYVS